MYREEEADRENIPGDASSRSERASQRVVERSGSLLGETVLRKTMIGAGKPIRSQKENEHITLGIITFRKGLKQIRLKGEGRLDPDLVLSRLISHTLCE